MGTIDIQKIKFFFVKLLVSTFSIVFSAWLLQKGIHIGDPKIVTGLTVAIVLLLVNMFLRPLMIMLTIPFTIGSFGLFLLIINAITIEIVDFFVDKFTVDGFGWAILFSLLVSITTALIDGIGKTKIVRIKNNQNSDDNEFSDYEEV